METKPTNPQKTKAGFVVLAISVALSICLLASLWLFLDQPNHRIGGVAWNALFQALGAPLAILGAILIFVGSLAGGISRKTGVLAALVLGASASYCLSQSFSIMMSV